MGLSMADGSAQLAIEERDGRRVLALSGALTLPHARELSDLFNATSGPIDAIDLSHVDALDTVGAWLVHCRAEAEDAEVEGANERQAELFERVSAADETVAIRPERDPHPVRRMVGAIGRDLENGWHGFLALLSFFGGTLVALAATIRHPRRFRVNAVLQQFEQVGIRSLGIIGLMSLLIGVVIAQQGAVQLRQFGAEVYTINLVGRLTLRELGVLMTAIMVAGRSGSAFAAQLGTMKLTEEIDAMRVIGVSPMEALVVPRVLASTLMMILLGVFSSFMGIIGGGVLAWASLGIPPATFIQRLQEVVPMTDFFVGLIKAPVFGAIIGLTGCYQGMQVEGDAEQVGLKTTAAVVQGIFLVIVLDAVFAIFFEKIGWI